MCKLLLVTTRLWEEHWASRIYKRCHLLVQDMNSVFHLDGSET